MHAAVLCLRWIKPSTPDCQVTFKIQGGGLRLFAFIIRYAAY